MQANDRAALGQQLREGVAQLPLSLSSEQTEQLLDYLGLLLKWNRVYNLTAVRDPAQMVTHHLLDSLAAVPAFGQARTVLDVGAGGGLPGMVLAIARRDCAITLVDTVHKKTAFLTQVKAELRLTNVAVQHARVEQMRSEEGFDIITSRAFAELNDFVTWSAHLLAPAGCFIALKGVLPTEEMARLPQGWRVARVEPLTVPGLDAERHLIFIEREDQA